MLVEIMVGAKLRPWLKVNKLFSGSKCSCLGMTLRKGVDKSISYGKFYKKMSPSCPHELYEPVDHGT